MFGRLLGQGDLLAISKNDAMTRLALLSQLLDLAAPHDITKGLVPTIMQILTKKIKSWTSWTGWRHISVKFIEFNLTFKEVFCQAYFIHMIVFLCSLFHLRASQNTEGRLGWPPWAV